MILYASQRANAAELARHLLNTKENDHVTVHEIRGFVSDDLAEALQEAYAISRGTRCRQFLFSVSLNPPEYADVPIEDFEAVIEDIERKLHLVGQPRIIVFHEKKGRRHGHVVWSRIDADICFGDVACFGIEEDSCSSCGCSGVERLVFGCGRDRQEADAVTCIGRADRSRL